MGMAASQARLLTLTARLHDVELKAQGIEAQKIALATQEDSVYQEYCDALDATKFQVAFRGDDATTKYVDATFDSLCNYSENRLRQYALRDNNSGKIIVQEDVAQNYNTYSNDKYAFAWAMLGYGDSFNYTYTDDDGESRYKSNESGIYVGKVGLVQDDEDSLLPYENINGYLCMPMTEAERTVFDEKKDSDTTLSELYDEISEGETKEEIQEALDTFREYFCTKYKSEIFDQMNLDKSGSSEDAKPINSKITWDDISSEFNHYVKLWETINEAGGCQGLDKQYQSGEEGATWLKNMVEAGLVSILIYNNTTSQKGWKETSVATSTNENHLQEVQDTTDQKKAEAKYEHEMKLISSKEKEYDRELSNLETERTSITTEMDSIKKVRDDNTERTFGIFS